MVADAMLSACIAYVTMHTIIAHFFRPAYVLFTARRYSSAVVVYLSARPSAYPYYKPALSRNDWTARAGFFGNQKPHVSRNFPYTLPATVVRSFRDGNNAMHCVHVFPVLWIASCFLTIYVTTYNTHYKIISQKFLTCSPRLFHFSSYTTTATCTSGSILPC